jgi:hypothetical protein
VFYSGVVKIYKNPRPAKASTAAIVKTISFFVITVPSPLPRHSKSPTAITAAGLYSLASLVFFSAYYNYIISGYCQTMSQHIFLQFFIPSLNYFKEKFPVSRQLKSFTAWAVNP